MTLTEIWVDVSTYGPIVVPAASAACAVLPKAPAGTVAADLQSIIEWLALNFGNAKAKAPSPIDPTRFR
jgi:hypothetical protein